eukprot:gene9868-2190_t
MDELFGEDVETDGEETPKMLTMKKSKSVTFGTDPEYIITDQQGFSISPKPFEENDDVINFETGNIAIMPPESSTGSTLLKKIVSAIFPNWIQPFLLIFEIICVIGAILLFYFTQNKNDISKLYYMPFLGLFGSIIATSAPSSGGLVFFPLVIILGLNARQAAIYSMGAQAISMGFFGTITWFSRDRKSIFIIPTLISIFFGCFGVTISIIAFPTKDALFARITFFFVEFFLCIYVIFGLFSGNPIYVQEKKFTLNSVTIFTLILTSVFGGWSIGYTGVGLGAFCFFCFTAFYKLSPHSSMVTSIIISGWTSLYSFVFHYFFESKIPFTLWLASIPGLIIGNRIGPILNKMIGTKIIYVKINY